MEISCISVLIIFKGSIQPYFNFLAMGSYFVIFTWHALRSSFSGVTGHSNDFCAKNGAGEAMSVDGRGTHSSGGTSCPGEAGALVGSRPT